jgi:putative Holliday junction resolvase
MNNDIGIRGKISESFRDELIKNGIDCILWDERLSTKTALQTMAKGSEKRSKQKAKKDELAAVLILQNYLDYKGANHVTR